MGLLEKDVSEQQPKNSPVKTFEAKNEYAVLWKRRFGLACMLLFAVTILLPALKSFETLEMAGALLLFITFGVVWAQTFVVAKLANKKYDALSDEERKAIDEKLKINFYKEKSKIGIMAQRVGGLGSVAALVIYGIASKKDFLDLAIAVIAYTLLWIIVCGVLSGRAKFKFNDVSPEQRAKAEERRRENAQRRVDKERCFSCIHERTCGAKHLGGPCAGFRPKDYGRYNRG